MTGPETAALVVVSANICSNPVRPIPKVRARVVQAAAGATVVFGQELNPAHPDYRAAWHGVAHQLGMATYGTREDLVSVCGSLGLTNVEHDTIRVHGGMPKVSPARYIEQVTGTLPNGLPVAFLACHLVSKPRRGVPGAWWRISRHELYLSRLAGLVGSLAHTHTVIYGGDMNATARGRLRGWKAHPAQQVLTYSGLDHLWAVAGPGARVLARPLPPIRRTRYMDHPIIRAAVRITPTGRHTPDE